MQYCQGALVALAFVLLSTTVGRAADVWLPTRVLNVPGSPIETVGCTAQRTDSQGGYLSDYYIRGNASFVNHNAETAVAVLIRIHYEGAYGNHDALIVKQGAFAPQVRIDPKRRALVALLQPEALNIDVDGSREIDIWDTIRATCSVVAARFADGSQWVAADDEQAFKATQEKLFPTTLPPAALPAPKCTYDANDKQYTCHDA